MDPRLKPGRYVIAVSGGVDSMVLLDILSKKPGIELVVAHFNHGIRADAGEDEKLVAEAAERYGLKLELGHGRLGAHASEATARQARYQFLESVRKKHKAEAIITAHHQDDLIETAILNTLRGTYRKGLSSIVNNPKIIRPMLSVPKQQIMVYATKNKLQWREDTTNAEEKYLRNYIRRQITPKLSVKNREYLLNNLEKVAKINKHADREIAKLSHKITKNIIIDRQLFALFPAQISHELMAHWLRDLEVKQFDKKTVERLSTAIKTAPAGSSHDVGDGRVLKLKKTSAHFSKNR